MTGPGSPARLNRRALLATLAAVPLAGRLAAAATPAPTTAERRTRNVVLVTLDGVRPEEVFTGAEPSLFTKAAGVADPAALKAQFDAATPEERRAKLMPFLWGTVAKQGQLLGSPARGHVARVTNGKNFSYPGYNELLTGKADDRVDSNDKVPNPNVSVLEWLNGRPEFAGRVAMYGCWDVFPFILNRERSGLRINSGWEPLAPTAGPELLAVDRIAAELPKHWDGVRYDGITYEGARFDLEKHRPRLLYIGLGETDDFAHEGRYDRYLDAANRSDAMLADLWNLIGRTPGLAGETTLLVTTDHGRGGLPDGWKNHGKDVKGAERIWIAALGPDTPALGEVGPEAPEATQSQIAATVAGLFGLDDAFNAAMPGTAKPVASIIAGR